MMHARVETRTLERAEECVNHLCGLPTLVLPEGEVVHIVKALAEVAQDCLWVAALGQDVQQVSRRHEVEAWEGDALCLQVVLRVAAGQTHTLSGTLLVAAVHAIVKILPTSQPCIRSAGPGLCPGPRRGVLNVLLGYCVEHIHTGALLKRRPT